MALPFARRIPVTTHEYTTMQEALVRYDTRYRNDVFELAVSAVHIACAGDEGTADTFITAMLNYAEAMCGLRAHNGYSAAIMALLVRYPFAGHAVLAFLSLFA